MDINKAEQIARNHKGTLLGYHTIPMPVYQVFVNYETFDDNPFFPISKALLQWVYDRENCEEGKFVYQQYVSSLLGINNNLIENVFQNLKKENYIYVDPETSRYRVSEAAKIQYIRPSSRPRKEVTGSVILDGKSFFFLPKDAYKPILNDEVNVWSFIRDQDIETHKPIDMSSNSESIDLVRIKDALDRHELSLEEIGLKHKDGKEFKVTQIEKKFISPVYLVYVGLDDGKICKYPYMGDVLLKTPALGCTDNFTFQICRDKKGTLVSSNLGYNANKETKNEYVSSEKNLIEDLVYNEYKIKEECAIVVSKTGVYWNITITEDILKCSLIPEKILIDCDTDSSTKESPFCRIRLNGKGVQGVLKLRIIHQIPIHLKLYKAIKANHDLYELESNLSSIAKDWRKKLIDMGMYSKLEEIDCNKYIHEF